MAIIKKFIKEHLSFFLILLLVFASRSSLADWYLVPTGSMQPTIKEGDRIFVNKLAYQLELPFSDISLMQTGTPRRGDIVVFKSQAADTRMVKRLIGLPGDKVQMDNNILRINGEQAQYLTDEETELLQENFSEFSHAVQFIQRSGIRDSFAVVVPPEHYLVLGDNRNNSADSRYYGFVPKAELQGKALTVLWSLDPQNYYLPRLERSFAPLI